MDNKETIKGPSSANILLYNEEYFKYIFKKTEKIAAAVFYTTRSLNDVEQKDTVITLLEDKARTLLETAEKTLRAPESARRLRLEELRISLIGLESALVVGNGARIVPLELLEVFRHEINSVHRTLKEYSKDQITNPLNTGAEVNGAVRMKRSYEPSVRALTGKTDTDASSGSGSRRERILSIIKDKGEASIKDVSSVISECSEKTIQRELMSLISEGRIAKHGERRWSKYTISA